MGSSMTCGPPLSVSPSAKLRLSLLPERGHTLDAVFTRKRRHEQFPLVGESRAERYFRGRLDGSLGEAQRERRVRRQRARELECARAQRGVIDQLIDQPDTMRLGRVDDVATQDQAQRSAVADEPRQSLRGAAAGDEAEPDLGLTEPRRARGDAYVARERELAAAAERKAVDHREHWLRECRNLIEDATSGHGRALLGRRALREFGDVGARDESFVS